MAEQPAPPPQLPPAPAPHAAAAPPAPEHEVADAVTAALRIVVSQPDLYLIKAAQASTCVWGLGGSTAQASAGVACSATA